MTSIHDKEVNNISEFNLLHDISNPTKVTQNLKRHCCPIIHRCMNTRRAKERFRNFRILLGSECSSTIVMRRLVEGLCLEKYDVM